MSSLSVKAYGVVVQDFCPLAINITRFSSGFRLNLLLLSGADKKRNTKFSTMHIIPSSASKSSSLCQASSSNKNDV